MGRGRAEPTTARGASPEEPSRRRLRQLFGYARKVYGLPDLLDGVRDHRIDPEVPTALIARLVLLVGLLRWRSFNETEARLQNDPEACYALGLAGGGASGPPMSIDTVAYALQRMDVASARAPSIAVVRKAERNKVFREGWHRALRYVAIDGWEPFCSRSRHCEACLTREIRVGSRTVTEYYHRFVVALLLDDGCEVVLGMEEVRSADVRVEQGESGVQGHEGELTAGKRLVPWLRQTYGRWLDVLVVDALYANGPFLTVAKEEDFGVVAVLKKATDEPLKEALFLFEDQRPQRIEVPRRKESWELWSSGDLRTLSTYDGPIGVVRARVTKEDQPSGASNSWCFGTTGVARKLSPRQVVEVGRGRWHIENTAFNQWTQHWKFGHVFTHGRYAVPALLWLFVLAFNLLQLFVYRQLSGWGRDRGSNTTRTIVRLVDEMAGDFARLTEPLDWRPG